jgi:hypothetical protein
MIIVIAAPLVLIGYFNFNQMPFEKFIMAWFRMNWNPQKRKFKYQPAFTAIRNEIIKEDKEKLRLEYASDRKKEKEKPKRNKSNSDNKNISA